MERTINPNQIADTDFSRVETVMAISSGSDNGTGVVLWRARLLADPADPNREGVVNRNETLLIAVEDPNDVLANADLEQRVIARRKAQGLTVR